MELERTIGTPAGLNLLSEVMHENLVAKVEKELMDSLMPSIKQMVKDAAIAACADLHTTIETHRDMRGDRLQMIVRFNDRTFKLGATHD